MKSIYFKICLLYGYWKRFELVFIKSKPKFEKVRLGNLFHTITQFSGHYTNITTNLTY